MQKLVLTNFQSPGDLVMLTAAVRDLHECYPNQFITDVRTCSPELWENNPYLTPLDADDPEVTVIDCQYPSIQASNQRPAHFLNGFIEFLNQRLGLDVRLTRSRGDLHLSSAEKSAPSKVQELIGFDLPYWIMVAGGKYDYTIKWWHFRRWQAVVDHFRGRIVFVQVGEKHHYHPSLNGVLDLRGRTSLRELIRLVHGAQGVVCPVTLLMHLAAAVECKRNAPLNRPCVVVAGGREPPSWEAYPTHQFIHTVGMLPCCAEGGCWKSRSVPLGDGDEKDQPKHLCADVIHNLPRCMHLIEPGLVIQKIELYLRGLRLLEVHPHQAERVAPFLFRRATLTSVRQGVQDASLGSPEPQVEGINSNENRALSPFSSLPTTPRRRDGTGVQG